MNCIKKVFIAFMAAGLAFSFQSASADEETNSTEKVNQTEVKEFSAVGEYYLGDDDTRSGAKIKALDDAKRQIAEKIGVFVQSYSEMNNSNLDKDIIKSVAAAMIKVVSENVEISDNGRLCKAYLVATADTDSQSIAEVIQDILKKKEPAKKIDVKVLELAGIYEWKDHFYKVFYDDMNWYKAKEYCEELGGHLVTITSKEEQAAIQSVILYSGKRKNYYWTGGFSVEKDNWRWSTGEEFTYSNWANGEPNNDLGNEFILSIYNSGEWNDCPAEGISHIPDFDFFKLENSGFICEWENFRDIKTQFGGFKK